MDRLWRTTPPDEHRGGLLDVRAGPDKQAQPEQGTVPTGNDSEQALADDITQFTTVEQSGPWLLAYLVARRVEPRVRRRSLR
ncbi:hypothetical protein GCM10010402_08320 [Actinomadura luteofluorescens]